MREFVLWLILLMVITVGCATRTNHVADIPVKENSTFRAPILTGSESSAELKKILAETKRSYAAVVSALQADIKETETAEVQTSLNWLTGFAVLGLLASFIAIWVIGPTKWIVMLALGFGGCIFVLQGLSFIAPYRYHVGAWMLVLGLVACGIWILQARDWKRFRASLGDGFQLKDLKQL